MEYFRTSIKTDKQKLFEVVNGENYNNDGVLSVIICDKDELWDLGFDLQEIEAITLLNKEEIYESNYFEDCYVRRLN